MVAKVASMFCVGDVELIRVSVAHPLAQLYLRTFGIFKVLWFEQSQSVRIT